jgi:hypothetical protein
MDIVNTYDHANPEKTTELLREHPGRKWQRKQNNKLKPQHKTND